MPLELLGVGKLVLLGLMYAFIWRVVRVIATDLKDPAPADAARAAPRPQVASQDRKGPARRPPASLVLHPPTGSPVTLELTGERIVFGRAGSSTQVLDDEYVSDEHAELAEAGGEWRVRDLGSTNGTYLNGRKVIAATAVAAGDQLQLGKTRIEVRR